MSVEVGLLEQSIAHVPPEMSDRLRLGMGKLVTHSLVVVGLQYPGEEPLVAAGYELAGNENRGASVTLKTKQAGRLAEAYMSCMVEKPSGVVSECSTFADYVMGWLDQPYRTLDSPYLRTPERRDAPTELDRLKDGKAYDFVISNMYGTRPGLAHVALGTNDPKRNFSKFGSESLVTMRNVDTVQRYTRQGKTPEPRKLASVSYRPF